MKTTYLLLAAVFAAASAIQAATVEHKLPAPMPEFKTPEQLAIWRKEMTEKAKATDVLSAKQAKTSLPEEKSAFYTGKPYIAESNSYAFKFRQYEPELNRWTTSDPSGFPDGANNAAYLPVPTSGFDWQGLKKIAWLYFTPSAFAGNPIGALNANITLLIDQMNSADAAQGSMTRYLTDGDTFASSVLITNTAAGINGFLSRYNRLVLFSHGSYFQNKYYWGEQLRAA